MSRPQAFSICRELATLLPHGSVIVMWSISVSPYIFPWAHNGPDIFIYRTGANGVRSALPCFHLIIFHLIVLSLLKSSCFFLERERRHIFTMGRETTTPPPPPLQLFFGNLYMLHDQVGKFRQKIRPRSLSFKPSHGNEEKIEVDRSDHPEVHPLTLFYTIFERNGTPFVITFHRQMVPLSHA